ncbi:MAG: site-2 protease family protein [Deltaproteobacteria bacterium]|nr:site-2 protease family protein [Deltaproteobacteria bacterium]
MPQDFLWQLSIWAFPVLVAIVFHEVAHGWVAYRLGDPTAAMMGRLTLNPLSHIDIVGTVLLPALLIWAGGPVFGYAKPVPVDYDNLKDPRRDMIRVALAGPGANIILAVLSLVIVKLILISGSSVSGSVSSYLWYMALSSVRINVMLAVFNTLPVPPLDGGRVLVGLLPEPQAMQVARIEPFGFIIVVALLMTGALTYTLVPIMDFIIWFLAVIVGVV